MYDMNIRKISTHSNTNNASLIVSGLGINADPNPNFVSYFERELNAEVYYFDRDGDICLQTEPNAVDIYIEQIKNFVDRAVTHGKSTHIFGISFGGYLSLRAAESIGRRVESLVAIAPLINPYEAFMRRWGMLGSENMVKTELLDGSSMLIRNENMVSVKDRTPTAIDTRTLLIVGGADEFETTESIGLITGANMSKRIIPGLNHQGVIENLRTMAMIAAFYRKIRAEHRG